MLFTISLTNNKDFVRLYKNGRYVNSKECVVYYAPNKLPFNRLGLTTSKKIGNAVLRNRARRVMRAAYQQVEILFPVGYDIVIVARTGAGSVKSDVIKDFFISRVVKNINKGEKNCQKSQKV